MTSRGRPLSRGMNTTRPTGRSSRWLAEINGRLVAHLRIYPRAASPRGGGTMRVARHRQRHHGPRGSGTRARGPLAADRGERSGRRRIRLLAAVDAPAAAVLEARATGEAPEEILHAVTGLPSANACVRPADDADLPVVAGLQNRFDADRSRSPRCAISPSGAAPATGSATTCWSVIGPAASLAISDAASSGIT